MGTLLFKNLMVEHKLDVGKQTSFAVIIPRRNCQLNSFENSNMLKIKSKSLKQNWESLKLWWKVIILDKKNIFVGVWIGVVIKLN